MNGNIHNEQEHHMRTKTEIMNEFRKPQNSEVTTVRRKGNQN
jgi:hypothetical protein